MVKPYFLDVKRRPGFMGAIFGYWVKIFTTTTTEISKISKTMGKIAQRRAPIPQKAPTAPTQQGQVRSLREKPSPSSSTTTSQSLFAEGGALALHLPLMPGRKEGAPRDATRRCEQLHPQRSPQHRRRPAPCRPTSLSHSPLVLRRARNGPTCRCHRPPLSACRDAVLAFRVALREHRESAFKIVQRGMSLPLPS